MIRSLPLVALLFVTGCKKDNDGEFWKWVGGHVSELRAVKTGEEPVVNELSAELDKAAPGLVFELGVGSDPFEFIISADGAKERFDAVKRLAGKAPTIPGLKVIAFRPRKEIDGFEMHLGELKLAAAEVKYLSGVEKDGKLSIDLYIEGYDATTEDAVKRAGFVLLDSAIGEFDMETRIGGIEFHGAPAPAGAKPLPALPAELDAKK